MIIVNEELLSEVKSYLNIYHNEDDVLISSMVQMAIEYIKDYTGLTDEEIEAKKNSLKVAIMLICSDAYDNRGQTTLQHKQNLLLTSILNLHSKNLL